jgi:hypothetical protein
MGYVKRKSALFLFPKLAKSNRQNNVKLFSAKGLPTVV